MNLVFGGAYQGKREYAAAQFGVHEIETCPLGVPAFSAPGTAGLENFSLYCVDQKLDSVQWLQERESLWQDKTLICQDISGGVVPIDPRERAWREENGRMLKFLAARAGHVARVFCGIGQVIR